MTSDESLALLRQGVPAWNQWRADHPGIKPNLTDANLSGLQFANGNLSDATLSDANLNDAKLPGVNLSGVILIGAHLSDTNLSGSNLHDADLTGADLTGANLSYAKLDGARFTGANMRRAILSGANLDGADLHGARLTSARLSGASIRDANLTSIDFNDAWLDDACMHGSSLGGSTFRNADLRRCDLGEASLWGVDLSDALLASANFEKAQMFSTIFGNNDLSAVRWLDSVRHRGPSVIGIDTIYASRGIIPDGFLRGAGVPDNFIAAIPSLVGGVNVAPFSSCFIKYSRKDEEFARKLYFRMQAEHVRVWFAPEDIEDGGKLRREIDVMLNTYDRLVLVLSADSMQNDWLPPLVRKVSAWEDKAGQRRMYPIRLSDEATLAQWECIDPETGTDIAAKLRAHTMPDFSNWIDPGAFDHALVMFLRELE